MRKLIIGAVTAVALLGAPAVAEAATAVPPERTPVTDPLNSGSPNGSITLPAGHNCVFAVDIAVVANNEFLDVTPIVGGNTVKITGKLVLRFKNDTTGKTIEENVSGPQTTTTTSPDGSSGTFQGEGRNWLAFGPHGQANTREPGLVFTSGKVTVTSAKGTAQTFSLNGTQENGCSLLS